MIHTTDAAKYEQASADYRIRLNGKQVNAFAARVSAMPFNHQWEGFQRPIEQTEMASFIHFSADEEVTIEVTDANGIREGVVRPLSAGVGCSIREGKAVFTLTKPGQYTFEPYGPHKALHIFFDSLGEWKYTGKEEGLIYFGPGVHYPGTIRVKSGETVYIDEDAVVYGSILGVNVENVTVCGYGILDDSREERLQVFIEKNGFTNYDFARGNNGNMKFVDSRNIVVDGPVLRDSVMYSASFWRCENVRIHNVKTIGMWRYNSDGFDLCNTSDKECFFVKNGEKIQAMGRYQLDFRNEKVKNYLFGVFRTLVEDYGVDYFKIDYNQCTGSGTEIASDSLGDGLLEHNRAYIAFLEELTRRYPSLMIESCASGGQRLDPVTLRMCQLVSVSDQTDYLKMAYIAANIGCGVLPEQAGIWCYPVALGMEAEKALALTPSQVDARIGEEQIAVNMVNGLMGRMYLASFIQLLPPAKQDLVREGLAFYRRMREDKLHSSPYLPLGYASFRDPFIVSGLLCEGRIYLAVWDEVGGSSIDIPLRGMRVKDICVGYPVGLPVSFRSEGDILHVEGMPEKSARMFVIETQE